MRKEKFDLYIQTSPSLCVTVQTSETMRFIIELIPLDKFYNILVIGCAEGKEVDILREFGYKQIFGITRGETNLKYANDNFLKENTNFEIMDMHDLEFPDKTFDAIYMNHVFEHSLAPFIQLIEMYSVLKDDGLAWIRVPIYDENAHQEINIISWHHPNMLPENSYKQLFNICFDIIKVINNGFLLQKKPFDKLHSDIQTIVNNRKGI